MKYFSFSWMMSAVGLLSGAAGALHTERSSFGDEGSNLTTPDSLVGNFNRTQNTSGVTHRHRHHHDHWHRIYSTVTPEVECPPDLESLKEEDDRYYKAIDDLSREAYNGANNITNGTWFLAPATSTVSQFVNYLKNCVYSDLPEPGSKGWSDAEQRVEDNLRRSSFASLRVSGLTLSGLLELAKKGISKVIQSRGFEKTNRRYMDLSSGYEGSDAQRHDNKVRHEGAAEASVSCDLFLDKLDEKMQQGNAPSVKITVNSVQQGGVDTARGAGTP